MINCHTIEPLVTPFIDGEIADAGLRDFHVLAVEGPVWTVPGVDEWLDDATSRNRLLGVLRTVESEPSLLGASAHLIATARV